jgi:exonuclease VII large subunit
MVADVRAATPTNAAQILVPDRQEIIRAVTQQIESLGQLVSNAIDTYQSQTREHLSAIFRRIEERLDDTFDRLATMRLAVAQLSPENVLKRGYALLRGDQKVGSTLEVETLTAILTTEVRNVRSK